MIDKTKIALVNSEAEEIDNEDLSAAADYFDSFNKGGLV